MIWFIRLGVVLCLFAMGVSTADAVPRFVGSSRLFEISQPGLFSRQAPAVERVETAASFYDFYSASSHTGFEYTRRALIFLYRDLRDEDNLSIFLLNGVDDMGQAPELRQPRGWARACVRGIPRGARIAVADDGTHEFDWSENCNGRPTNSGNLARGYWSYANNTDGGAIDRISTDVDWDIEVEMQLGVGMDEWRYFMADGADIMLDTSLPLIIRSRAANAGDTATSAEGQSMTVCALAVDDANPAELTYTFHWNDGSDPTTVRRPPAELACSDHVFPDSGQYNVRIDVADPQGRGESKNFEANMEPAPPRLYPQQDVRATTEIPVVLTVRAEDGLADVHRSRWDFNNDGQWDTGWVDGVEREHIFANPGRHTVRMQVIDNENLSATTEFDVNVALRIPRCGDGVLDPQRGEACDDGNAEERDLCSSGCEWRPELPEVTSSQACPLQGDIQRCVTIQSQLVATGPSPVTIDLSASIDPNSRAPLRFLYSAPDGMGRFIQQPDFADNLRDMGPAVQYVPRGDGARVDQITVQVFDAEGNVSRATIPIQVPNTPPTIGSVDYEQALAPPQIIVPADGTGWPIESGGIGRHRLTLPIDDAANVIVTAQYSAREQFDETLAISIDTDADGNRDRALFERGGRYVLSAANQPERRVAEGFASFVVPEREFPADDDVVLRTVRLYVSDGDPNGEVMDEQRVWVRRPVNEDEQYRYTIDVGDDGAYETVNSLDPIATFSLPPGTVSVPVTGFSMAPNGDRFPFEIEALVLPNTAPEFRNVRVVSQKGFDVVILVSVTDPDGETVSTQVDWGDGHRSSGRNVVFTHSYANSGFRPYTIRIRATDSRGLFVEETLEIDIVRTAIREAEISSLSWERLTETEGNYDGVRAFAMDSAGTLFTHNYMDMVRRSTDDGDNWTDILRDVECCGSIATKNAGEIYLASPAGLYFSGDNGDNWALFDGEAFLGVAVSPDQNYVIAATKGELRRFDTTGRLLDSYRLDNGFNDLASCAGGNRSAFTNRIGQLYINDRRDMNPDGWRIPEDRFAKNNGLSSISFDSSCNLYHGVWNGYRILKTDNSIVPSSVKSPKHLLHILGSSTRNVYGGAGSVTSILAWPEGAAIVGSERGVWGENEPRNAYRTPYWTKRDRGVDRSKSVRAFALNPGTGLAYMATSSAVQVPRYCRRARRNNRGRGRRGGRGRTAFYYVFCGFQQNYFGGLYRSESTLLLSRTIGEGGSAFDPQNSRGVVYDGNQGGLGVAVDRTRDAALWIVNTAESTVSQWRTNGIGIRELAKYRVGLPAGECPGSCCFDDGCNMAGPVAMDDQGDAYIVSRGYGMQGTVTKVAGDLERCLDRNNNGRIDTAGTTEPMDYGADECVLWTVPVGGENAILRSVAVDLGDDQTPSGYIWVGGYRAQKAWKLSPRDGEILEEVDLRIEPYAMMVDAVGRLWVATLGVGNLQWIDTRTNEVNPALIDQPRGLRDGGQSSYSMTIDAEGRVWQNGWTVHDAIAYDPESSEWCRIVLPNQFGNVGRGITVDSEGRVWTAVGGDGQSHLAWWDAADCVGNQSVALPADQFLTMPRGIEGPTALSADRNGNLWLAHHISQKLLKIEPRNNFAVREFDGTNRVFSFSDFTGLSRQISIGQGSYIHDFEADCDEPHWTALSWSARTPPGSSIGWSAQTAARRNKLSEGRAVSLGQAPNDDDPLNVSGELNGAEVASRRFLRIRAALSVGERGHSPILQSFTIRWNCD